MEKSKYSSLIEKARTFDNISIIYKILSHLIYKKIRTAGVHCISIHAIAAFWAKSQF